MQGESTERYATIVVDPPWDYGADAARWMPNRDRVTRLAIPYAAMSTEAISALPISDLAERHACLWLWTTNRHIHDALGIVAAWGFSYRQLIVWAKDGVPPMSGSVCPNGAEYLLHARRGRPTVGRWEQSSVIHAPRPTKHSRKPEVFLDLIESVSPEPRLEMFARRNRLGWSTWGNECLAHDDLLVPALSSQESSNT